MLSFTDFSNDIEDFVEGAIADGTSGTDRSPLFEFSNDAIADLLTGDTIDDVADDLLSAVGDINSNDVANVIDGALPVLGTVLGGPFGSASILSLATDLITGQTVGELVGEGLDLWFDRDDYLARNPDVAECVRSPVAVRKPRSPVLVSWFLGVPGAAGETVRSPHHARSTKRVRRLPHEPCARQ